MLITPTDIQYRVTNLYYSMLEERTFFFLNQLTFSKIIKVLLIFLKLSSFGASVSKQSKQEIARNFQEIILAKSTCSNSLKELANVILNF